MLKCRVNSVSRIGTFFSNLRFVITEYPLTRTFMVAFLHAARSERYTFPVPRMGLFLKSICTKRVFFKVVDMMISFRRPLKVCNAFITCRQVVLVIPNLIGLSPYFGSPAGSSEEIGFFLFFSFLVFL